MFYHRIFTVFFEKYGEDPMIEHKSMVASFLDGLLEGGYSRLKVENEIYERSFHEATSFFLNHGDEKFDDKTIEILQFRLKVRLQNPKQVRKLTPEEMFAHLIKIYVIDFLLEDGLVI
jgi:hypothetical protein